MQGKTVVITGANSGIGKETARNLGRLGAQVVMVCRNRSKGEAALQELAAEVGDHFHLFVADLALLEDVRRLAGELTEKFPKIDVLVNNAGIYLASRQLTKEGLETTFVVNHLAPFLLTRLLWSSLATGTPARVVNVTSVGHKFAKLDWDNLQGEKYYVSANAYGIAKLANILFTYELAKRAQGQGVSINCMHPGAVASNFAQDGGGLLGFAMSVGRLFLLSPAKAAARLTRLVADEQHAGTSGVYFVGDKKAKSSGVSNSPEASARMWAHSCRLTGLPENVTPL